jgi:hypothetical protein
LRSPADDGLIKMAHYKKKRKRISESAHPMNKEER